MTMRKAKNNLVSKIFIPCQYGQQHFRGCQYSLSKHLILLPILLDSENKKDIAVLEKTIQVLELEIQELKASSKNPLAN